MVLIERCVCVLPDCMMSLFNRNLPSMKPISQWPPSIKPMAPLYKPMAPLYKPMAPLYKPMAIVIRLNVLKTYM